MIRFGKLVIKSLDGNGDPLDYAIDVVIEADQQPSAQFGEWVPCGNAGPGWSTFDKLAFSAPPQPEEPSLVPASITMRQARLVLLSAGKLNAISAAIDALPSPTKERAQIEWEYSNEVQRHNGFVTQLAPALNLTSEQIDALFLAGKEL